MATFEEEFKSSIDDDFKDLGDVIKNPVLAETVAGSGTPTIESDVNISPAILNGADFDNVDADSHINDNNRGNILLHGATNIQRGARHDLRLAKARAQRGRVQNFVADICGVSPNKKMTKKNTLASLLWFGAKLTAASIVFGPLVGCWLATHMANYDYYAKKEGKVIDFMNTMLFDSLLQSPSGTVPGTKDTKYGEYFGNLSPKRRAEQNAKRRAERAK